MSYMQFQQKCADCGAEWNAAFGIVGMTQIAAPPKVCPKCESPNIKHLAHGWKLFCINHPETELPCDLCVGGFVKFAPPASETPRVCPNPQCAMPDVPCSECEREAETPGERDTPEDTPWTVEQVQVDDNRILDARGEVVVAGYLYAEIAERIILAINAHAAPTGYRYFVSPDGNQVHLEKPNGAICYLCEVEEDADAALIVAAMKAFVNEKDAPKAGTCETLDIDTLIASIMARRTAASGVGVFVDPVILRGLIHAAFVAKTAPVPQAQVGGKVGKNRLMGRKSGRTVERGRNREEIPTPSTDRLDLPLTLYPISPFLILTFLTSFENLH